MEPKKPEDFLSLTSESGQDDSLQDTSLRNLDLLSDVEDLTERFSQQQDMITQIKEMVIAEETARNQKNASTRLKMEKCTSQLAKIRDRARTNKKITKTPDTSVQYLTESFSEPKSADQSIAEESQTISRVVATDVGTASAVASTAEASITTVTEKPRVSSREATKMLHQQIKERKAMIAERTKNEKQLEQALLKIQKQLEDNQNISAETVQIGQSKINFDFRPTIVSDDAESNKVVIELRNRIVQLESNVLDLQETCKEKDSVIKSKTEAITLMSADLSMKGKNTLDLLDDTKEQMQKMQENFATMENDMKLEKQSLVNELEACQNKVKYLEEANTILEDERFKLSIDNSDLEEKINMKNIEISRLNDELQTTMNQVQELLSKHRTITDEGAEEKGITEISNMESLTKKIETLEEINTLLKESNTQLQDELKSIKEKKITKEMIRPPTSAAAENEYLLDVVKVLETISQSLNKRVLDVDFYLSNRESKIIQMKEENSLNIPKDTINPEIVISDIATVDDDTASSLPDKIKLLENLNYLLKKSNIELENKLSSTGESSAKPIKPVAKINKPVLKGKAAAKAKQQQTAKVEIPKDANKIEEFNSIWSTIKNLGVFIESLRDQILNKEAHLSKVDDEINRLNREFVPVPEVKPIDDDKSDEVSDPELPTMADRLENALKQIDTLSQEMADANKSMIKLKATHKTKVKQMQKSIDDFSKVSESNAELVRLQSLVDTLTQKVTELEDDKGNLQLHLVDYDSDRVSDSQLHAKLLDVERLAEERHKAIADLEMQKFDLVQELHLAKQTVTSLEDKVADLSFLENEHVSAELKLAQLEEELDLIKAENKKILIDVDNMISEKKELVDSINLLNKEKSEISGKLEFYIQENIELIDRLEKLSAEKVSSAESIEMVESLTSQEKMEIEQYQKTFSMLRPSEKDIDEMKEDENLTQDNSEKSELLSKIDLYTAERQEVMEKLEHYLSLNDSLNARLQELEREKEFFEGQYNTTKDDRDNVLQREKLNETQITALNSRIEELIKENAELLRLNEEKTEKESDVTENVDQLKKESTKTDKKNTKEILRLKGLIKNKDSEITTLNNKLAEVLDGNKDNEKLEQSLKEISSLNEQLKLIKEEKCNYDSSTNDLHVVINTNTNKILSLEENIKIKDDHILQLENKLVSDETASKNIASMLENSIIELINVMNENNTEGNNLEISLTEHLIISDKINELLDDLQRKLDILSVFLRDNKNKIDDACEEQRRNVGIISQLEKECFNKDETIRDLNQQLSEINHSLDAKSQSIADLEIDLNRLNEQYRKREVDNSTSEENNATVKLIEVESELKIKIDQLSNLKLELKNLSDEHQITLSSYIESNDNAIRLQSDFSTLQLDYNSLLSDLTLTKDEAIKLNENLHEAQNKLIELTREKENNVSTIQTYKQDCNNLISQNNSLSAKLKTYEAQLQEVEQQSISHLEKLQEKTTECENIKLALTKMNAIKDQMDSKQIEVNSLIEQLEDVRSSYKEFQSAHDAKIQEREGFVESLEINLNKQQDKITRLEENLSRMESLEKKINSLTAKLQEKDILFAEKLQRENELDQNITDLTSQNKQLQKQSLQLQNDNSHHADNNKHLTGVLKQYEIEMDSLKSEAISLKNYLGNYQNIEREYVAVSEKYSRLEAEFKDKMLEYADMLKNKSTECESLESSMQSQCDNFDMKTKQYKEECKKLQDELSINMHKLKDAESEIANVKLENESLLSEKERLSKLDESKLQKSSDDIIRLQNERDNLISLINEKEAELGKYRQQSSHLQMNNEVVFNKLKAECDKKDIEINRLKTQFDDCLSQLKDLIESEKALKQYIANKDSLIAELQSELSSCKNPFDAECAIKKVQHFDNVSQYFTNETKQTSCFDDLKDLQDQIIPSDSFGNIDVAENSMIRSFFHDTPTPINKAQAAAILSSDVPIVEEVIQPKKTYECFDSKVTELEDNVKLLTDEKNKLANDLAQSQTKTNKALLKLKEYKLRYDSVSAELKKIKAASNTNDLDFAIQDELYLQIKNLEDSLKELRASTDKDKAEKDSLLKRVDVLTSANERLIAMKEKQDMEMQIYASNNEKLNKKLEIAQWDKGFDDNDFIADSGKDNIKEKPQSSAMSLKEVDILKEKICLLEADNDDLQSILDKQDIDLKTLAEDNKKMKNQTADNSKFEEENANLKIKLDENNNIISDLKEKLLNCEEQLMKSSDLINSLNSEMDERKNEICDLKQKLEMLNNDFASLQTKYNSNSSNSGLLESEYKSAVDELRSQINEYSHSESKYKSELENLTKERDEMLKEYDEYKLKIAKNDSLIDSKSQEIFNLQVELENSTIRIKNLQEEFTEERRTFGIVKNDLEQRIAQLELTSSSTEAILETNCMKQLNETSQKLQLLVSEHDELKSSSESRISALLSQIEALNDSCNKLKSDLDELTETHNQALIEKSYLEPELQSAKEDLQKYYNYEKMCNDKFNEFNTLFNAKDKEIIDLSEQFNLSLQAISAKDVEISNKDQEVQFLQRKIVDHDQLLQHISELETKLNDMDHEKEAELANLRLTLHSERTELEQKILRLNDEIKFMEEREAKISNTKMDELQTLVNEESVQMTEMRSALESQEYEIVTLKENLAAQIDAYEKLKLTAKRHVTFAEDTKPSDESGTSVTQTTRNAEASSSRADLDLALYMLHQRDVRCEELTSELRQLLDERDTLQLKLSNSIRMNEELRNSRTPTVHESSPVAPTVDDSVDETGEDATQSVIVSEPHRATSVEPSLESKLSELHSVNYSRDVRVKDESESRQRQMELLQRDVQNLPPEAAAHLREAHYTLSRDTQSASTVIFNWLWGRTTPKVMHM